MFLLVQPNGNRVWRYKFRLAGKEGSFTLGHYPAVSLAEAREQHDAARKQVAQGVHPTQQRRLARLQQSDQREATFQTVAERWFAAHVDQWTTGYQAKNRLYLDRDLIPALGKLPIVDVRPAHILAVIERVQARGHAPVAQGVRRVARNIFRYGVSKLLVETDPTAVITVRAPRTKHHPVLDADGLTDFLQKIEVYGNRRTALALRLLVLTFLRKSEVTAATWAEIDWDAKLWRIPGARMKMGQAHVVPLARQALEALRELHDLTGDRAHLFPNVGSIRRPMGGSTLNHALVRMGIKISPHGVRGTASTILHEMGFRSEVIERQLAHARRNQVAASYDHSEYLPERRTMMQAWADFLDDRRNAQKVVLFRQHKE